MYFYCAAILSFVFRERRHLVVLPQWFQADEEAISSSSSSNNIQRRQDGALLMEQMPSKDEDEDDVVYDAESPDTIHERVLVIHRCTYEGPRACAFHCPHGEEVEVYVKQLNRRGKQGKTWQCDHSPNCNVKAKGFLLEKKCNPRNIKYAVYDRQAGFKMNLRRHTLRDIYSFKINTQQM
jgi:hypothetical protein